MSKGLAAGCEVRPAGPCDDIAVLLALIGVDGAGDCGRAIWIVGTICIDGSTGGPILNQFRAWLIVPASC